MQGLIFTVLLHVSTASTLAYPIQVSGNESAVQTLVRLINCETYANDPSVEFQMTNKDHEYGLLLRRPLENQGYSSRTSRFQCALNYLLGDPAKVVRLQLVENDPRVLIADAQNAIIDIADIEKFNSNTDGNFTAFNVLLHELYEQYQLQVVAKLRPGKISSVQLKKAHQRAIQKESNFYSLTMLRTQADINDDYIHIEFVDRANFARRHYYAYFSNGNIDRIERN